MSKPSTKQSASAMRVFAVARQSRTNDGSKSIEEQFALIEADAEREGLTIVGRAAEPDTSGGARLSKRAGLLRGVQMIEDGTADVIEVAYFDRLVRSLDVQREILERVEAAGGRVRALDIGEVSNSTAVSWVSATVIGMVAEYLRRSTAERSHGAQVRAIAEGRPVQPHLPLGMRRNPQTKVLEHDPARAGLVVEVFERRLRGATVKQLQKFLAEHDVRMSEHAIRKLLVCRTLLGELRWGKIVNESACPPVVPPRLFRRVGETVVPGGRKSKIPRLLARLGVLHCAACGSRMVLTNPDLRPQYKCGQYAACAAPTAINADAVETHAAEETKRILRGIHGRASYEAEIADARERAARAEAELEAAIEALSGIVRQSAREKLQRLQRVADEAAADVEQLLRTAAPIMRVSVDDWDLLSLDARRELVTLAIERIEVARAERRGGNGGDPLARVNLTPRLVG